MACGCAETGCPCIITGAGQTTVSGSGTVLNPFVISSPVSPTFAATNPLGGILITPNGTLGHAPALDITIDPASTAPISVSEDGIRVDCCDGETANRDIEKYRINETSPFIDQTYPYHNGTSGTALVSGTVYFSQIPVIDDIAVATGLGFILTVNGSYTATTNKIGLYSSDGTTLTLVASSPDVPSLWQPGSTGGKQQAFTAPVALTAGIYYVGFLRYSSASATDPELMIKTGSTFATRTWGDDSLIAGSLAAQTDLPASTALSGLSNGLYYRWAGIY